MKKLILSIAVVFSVSTYSQTNTVEKTKETIPQDVAVFVDMQLTNSEVLKSLQPNDIESMNVVKRDTIIDSKKYKGQIFIKMKKK
jgi:ABC-type iron transport system FetAB permease component